MSKGSDKKQLDFSIISKYRSELFGISIILIMVFHYFHTVVKYYWTGGKLYFISYVFCEVIGSIGVEVFFFLSGLGLYFSYTKNKDTGVFFKKRFIRILVPYLVFGSVMWLITDIFMSGLPFTRYLYDLSLFPFWISGSTRLWFLSAILVFYVFFPLFYEAIVSKNYKRNTFLLIAFFVLALIMAYTEKPKAYKLTEIALTRIPVFILGIYFGRLVFERAKIKPAHIIVFSLTLVYKAFAAALALKKRFGTLPDELKPLHKTLNTAIGGRFSSGIYSLGLMMLFIALLSLIKWKAFHKFLTLTGSISLELYMVHVSVNWIIRKDGTLDLCMPHIYFPALLVSVLISIILHKLSNILIKKLSQTPGTT